MPDPSPREPPPPPDLVTTEWDAIDKREVLDYDAESETYRASFASDREPIREVILATLAVVSETPPLELPSLHSVIDSDAVERLIEVAASDPASGDVHISFTSDEWNVTVHSYGVIAVRPLDEDATD